MQITKFGGKLDKLGEKLERKKKWFTQNSRNAILSFSL